MAEQASHPITEDAVITLLTTGPRFSLELLRSFGDATVERKERVAETLQRLVAASRVVKGEDARYTLSVWELLLMKLRALELAESFATAQTAAQNGLLRLALRLNGEESEDGAAATIPACLALSCEGACGAAFELPSSLRFERCGGERCCVAEKEAK